MPKHRLNNCQKINAKNQSFEPENGQNSPLTLPNLSINFAFRGIHQFLHTKIHQNMGLFKAKRNWQNTSEQI